MKKEIIKAVSLVCTFLVMVWGVYMEVEVAHLIKRTAVTFIACHGLGFMAILLTNVMMGKQSINKSAEPNRP
jgi:hypothetical protein